tara:strand:- start:1475 stop:1684 length:210 start_codon:yes stop_codon:yes gene_type:complete
MQETSYTFFGITFYEHPSLGDESPLLVLKDCEYHYTGLYGAPCSQEEAQDEYDNAEYARDLYGTNSLWD